MSSQIWISHKWRIHFLVYVTPKYYVRSSDAKKNCLYEIHIERDVLYLQLANLATLGWRTFLKWSQWGQPAYHPQSRWLLSSTAGFDLRNSLCAPQKWSRAPSRLIGTWTRKIRPPSKQRNNKRCQSLGRPPRISERTLWEIGGNKEHVSHTGTQGQYFF